MITAVPRIFSLGNRDDVCARGELSARRVNNARGQRVYGAVRNRRRARVVVIRFNRGRVNGDVSPGQARTVSKIVF